MKTTATFLILLIFFTACKQKPKTTVVAAETKDVMVDKVSYPEALGNIFEVHGGIDLWKKQRTLSFVLPRPENPETHTIDLWSRNEKIATSTDTIGFDGKPWVLDANDSYEGNPEFYHNLMFYFYAMPFVLADKGIVYNEVDDLIFEDVSYPGIKISYNEGVGTSPKDDYYLHYNPETHQMEWLGYTVTYRSGEKSDKVNWIRYDDWKTINGLVLPNSISWYNVKEGNITELRNQVIFGDVTISDVTKPTGFYDKPENGQYWEKRDDE